MKSSRRYFLKQAGVGFAFATGLSAGPLARAEEKRYVPKAPPAWTGFGLNGSAGAARFDLTRRYVEKYQQGLPLTDPKAFAFLRQPLRDLLAKQSPPLVRLDNDAIKPGEDLLVGMVHDYEASVAIRRVEFNKPVQDGNMVTFMAGAGMVLGYQKSAGWRVVSAFPFMTRVELPIADVTKLRDVAVDSLEKIYNVHAQAFVHFLGRFSKWREGYAPNYFARVVSATIGKKAQPKLAEHGIEKLLTAELLGFEASSVICDGFDIPLIPFQENDALAKRYATKFSESMAVQDALELPEIDLEFEVNLVDLTKEKIPSRQKGIITIKRQIALSFRAFDRVGKGPDGRNKILQSFAVSPIHEDVFGYAESGDDTPDRDLIFFERLIYRTLRQLVEGLRKKDAARLSELGIKFEEIAPATATLLQFCEKAR